MSEHRRTTPTSTSTTAFTTKPYQRELSYRRRVRVLAVMILIFSSSMAMAKVEGSNWMLFNTRAHHWKRHREREILPNEWANERTSKRTFFRMVKCQRKERNIQITIDIYTKANAAAAVAAESARVRHTKTRICVFCGGSRLDPEQQQRLLVLLLSPPF